MKGLLTIFRRRDVFAPPLRMLTIAFLMLAIAAAPLAHICPAVAAPEMHVDHAGPSLTDHGAADQDMPALACKKDCCVIACIGSVLPVSAKIAVPINQSFLRWSAQNEVKCGIVQRVATPPPRLA